MKRLKHSKPVALLIALLLVFQLLPMGTALAEGRGEDTPIYARPVPDQPVDLLAMTNKDNGRNWVVLTNTSGTPSPAWEGAPSAAEIATSIVVKDASGKEMEPDGDTYKNVPANGTIDVEVGFWLNYSDGEGFLDGDYFKFDLPKGLEFEDPSNGVIKLGTNGQEFASWSIDTATNKLTVTLTDMNGITDDVWASFGFHGTFKYTDEDANGGNPTSIQFGGQIITIERKENDVRPPDQSQLKKTYEYDPAANEIIWKVDVTPKDGKPEDYRGFQLVDTLAGTNHTYKPGSFSVTNGLSGVDEYTINDIDDANVSVDGQKITFKLPTVADGRDTPIPGPLTFTYKTIPTISSTSENNKYMNNAQLYKGTTPASNLDTKTFNLNSSLKKNGALEGQVNFVDGKAIYKWVVSVTLPQTPGDTYTYPNAQIIDTLQALNAAAGIAEQQFLVDDTHRVTIQVPGGTAQEVPANVANTNGLYSTSGDTLTYSFPNGHPVTSQTESNVYTLTYYTEVTSWDSSLNSNSAVKVGNNAKFQWEYADGSGTGTGTSSIPGATVSVTGANGLIKKELGPIEPANNETYTYQENEYIQWKVTVNHNKINMGRNVKVTDELPAGLDFVIDGTDHKLVLSDGAGLTKEFTGTDTGADAIAGLVQTASSGGFTLNLNTAANLGSADLTKTYTITFWSKINPEGVKKFYANGENPQKNNGTVSFQNVANLFISDAQTASANATKVYSTQMLQKSTVDANYNYTSRIAKWTIVVNRNKLKMTNAVLNDTLPAELQLVVDADHPFEVKKSDGAAITEGITAPDKGTAFTVVLPTPTLDTYTITFYTYVLDPGLQMQGNDKKAHFKNEAVLTMDGGYEVKASDTLDIDNKVITKSYTYDVREDDTVKWKVEINHAKAKLQSASITDNLNSALSLIKESIKLYEVNVNSEGNLETITGKTPITLAADAIVVNGQTFTLNLPDGAQAYVLTFETAVVADATLTNTINFTGSNGSSQGSSSANPITVVDQYARGGSGSYVLRIKKVDENGAAINGVQFALKTAKGAYLRGGLPLTGTTGAGGENPGEITFKDLPNWTYYISEIDSPTGYFRADDAGGAKPTHSSTVGNTVHIIVENELALAPVQITKVGAGGVGLSGGKFTLAGTSAYSGSTYTISDMAAIDGKVKFENVPIGTYTITETKAPEGHKLDPVSPPTVSVTVGYEDPATKTGVKVTYSGGTGTNHDILVNEPTLTENNAKVSFTKTDDKGNPIKLKEGVDGGTFTLTGTNDAGSITPIERAVDANGLVDFGKLKVGSYKITETVAPAGYLNLTSKDIFTVVVAYKDTNYNNLEVTMTPLDHNEERYVAESKQFENTPAVGDVTFTKKDSSSDKVKINGGTFVIEGTSLGGQSVSIEAHAVEGVVTFKDVPVGNDYTIKETVPPSGYFLTTKTLTGIKVEYTDAETRLAVSDVVLESILTNDPIPYVPSQGKVSVTKVDESGKPLAGATFTLYDASGKAVASMTTGSSGIAEFTKLQPYTSYTIQETAAPEGYKLSDEVLTADIKDGTVLTFTMTNEKIAPEKPVEPEKPVGPETPVDPENPGGTENPGNPSALSGSLTILKLNRADIPLAGAEFTLYDAAGSVLAIAVSGADGMVRFDYLAPRTYRVAETKAPAGYQLFTEALTVEITQEKLNLGFTLRNAAEQDPPEVAGWEDDPIPLGGTPGTLPKTGEIPTSLYLLVGGLGLLAAGFVTMLPRKKAGKRVAQRSKK